MNSTAAVTIRRARSPGQSSGLVADLQELAKWHAALAEHFRQLAKQLDGTQQPAKEPIAA